MDNYTAKILLREDFEKKDGTSPIYLRLTINRKTKKYSLNLSTKKEWWDNDSSRIRRGDPLKFKHNLLIEQAEKKANDLLYDHRKNQKRLTFFEFEKIFFDSGESRGTNPNSYYDFAIQEIELLYRSGGSKETYRTQKSFLTKTKKFAGDSLNFNDIDIKFIESFKEYMIVSLGNNYNTWVKSFSFMKSIINKAIKKELVKDNIFRKFSFPVKAGNREYLTSKELEAIEKKLEEPDLSLSHRRALIPFIFCCYSGLRFQDVCNLRYKDIKTAHINGKECKVIKIIMHKTKDMVEIPLALNAIKLIPEGGFAEQKIFRVYTNQPQNRYLKEIAKEVKIDKQLSFHCARHTFATILLTLDVHIEVISKLLGHTNLRTTQIYARVLPESKVNAIDRLNGIY